jgi:hypothetical protein
VANVWLDIRHIAAPTPNQYLSQINRGRCGSVYELYELKVIIVNETRGTLLGGWVGRVVHNFANSQAGRIDDKQGPI